MKKQRILAFLLSLSLLLASSVQASEALGDDLAKQTITLGKDTTLTHQIFYSNTYADLRQERYITYTPNRWVSPQITYGDSVTALSTVKTAVQRLEEQQNRVLSGINGGFYVVANGSPIGAVIADGVLQSGSPGGWTVGFRQDGSVLMGDMGLTLSLVRKSDESSVKLTALNRVRGDSGLYLYTHNFNAKGTTGCIAEGTDVLCRIDGSFALGESLTLTVEEVLTPASGTAVPEGMAVLTVNHLGRAEDIAWLQSLTEGEELSLTLEVNADWEEVVCGLGSFEKLLENGVLAEGLTTTAAPRTAIGVRADGTAIFYTIDGRQSGYSIGASMRQVAQRLLELGCVNALSLDGGGSTTLVTANPDEATASVKNSPSEGSLRSVSNQLLLVNAKAATGRADSLYLGLDETKVLAGTTLPLHTAVLDTAGYPIEGAKVSVMATAGTVQEDTWTAPAEGGLVTLTGSYGRFTAQTTVEVIAQPTVSVKIGKESYTQLTLAQNSQTDLQVALRAGHLPLSASDTDVSWTVTGEIGTITEEGLFTAAETAGEGSITVTAGESVFSLPVQVQSTAPRLTLTQEEGSVKGTVSCEAGTIPSLKALQVVYDGTLVLPLTFEKDTGIFSAELPEADGKRHRVTAEAEDMLGRHSRISLDIAEAELTSPFADTNGHWAESYLVYLYEQGAMSGVAVGDMLLAKADSQITRQELAVLLWRSLTAEQQSEVIREDLPFADSESIAPWAVEAAQGMTAMGIIQGSTQNGELVFAPQAVVTRAQAVTMLGRLLGTGYAVEVGSFSDAEAIPTWAIEYVSQMQGLGILGGFPDGSFRPDAPMTRGQTAKVLYQMR